MHSKDKCNDICSVVEGQPELQPVIDVKNEKAQSPADHYVNREFFRNLITDFTLIISLYLIDTEIKTIIKGVILNLICGTFFVPLN